MADSPWVNISEVVKNSVETLGILVGGAWAYWRFVLKRERETALEIDLRVNCVQTAQDPQSSHGILTHFDVRLTNKGVVRVTAKPSRSPAYTDRSETLKYSGGLLLRAIKPNLPEGTAIRWFPNAQAKSPLPDDIEADLLDEYELSGRTDFWMEPGETYHVGTALVLPRGAYLAMVTFVAANRDTEFWRRIFLVQIPEDGLPKATNTSVIPAVPPV